jgi:hypothetical protein
MAAQGFGDRIGEIAKAAGGDDAMGAMVGHRRNQAFRAGH